MGIRISQINHHTHPQASKSDREGKKIPPKPETHQTTEQVRIYIDMSWTENAKAEAMVKEVKRCQNENYLESKAYQYSGDILQMQLSGSYCSSLTQRVLFLINILGSKTSFREGCYIPVVCLLAGRSRS